MPTDYRFTGQRSETGVTGVRDQVAKSLAELVERVRQVTTKPVCVGFGIANAETAQAVASFADGVIAGSALVPRIGQDEEAVSKAQEFVEGLRAAIDS